jgi:NAD(P)-dependent dehydrogenase (short-subunit alcohol dehydrogenase family)
MKNKVVLITGSSNGIGKETAYKFAAEKAKLVVTYCNDKPSGEKVCKKCRQLGASEAFLIKLNLKDNKSIMRVKDRVTEKFGRIDVLINNAGVAKWKPLKKQSFADIEHQIRTNLEGLIKMTRVCLPSVKKMIINIASGAGQTGFADLAPYCSTKFGVRGFTQALAEEVSKVKIIAVNPDMTKTRMTDFQGRPPEQVAQVVLNTAKGRYKVKSGGDVNVWDVWK